MNQEETVSTPQIATALGNLAPVTTDLVEIDRLIARFEDSQQTSFACNENDTILSHLKIARHWIEQREQNRLTGRAS